MKYILRVHPPFVKVAKRLGKKYPSLRTDIQRFMEELLANPNVGVDMGYGIRKIRMSITSKGCGKSGGARVITFNLVASVDETEIHLLFLYDKAERSSISKDEILQKMKDLGLK